MSEIDLILELQRQIGQLEGRLDALEARPSYEGGPVTEAGPSTAETFICPKVTLSRLIDKRVKMELWLLLGNGELSQWPQLTYTGDDEAVLGFMPQPHSEGQWNLDSLPFEVDVSWDIAFKWGRKTGKLDDDGNPTHYKDLVSITERESE